MKYRIKTTFNDKIPFKVQRLNEKSFIPLWRTIDKFEKIYHAEQFMKQCVERHSKYPPGEVVAEYNEEDLVVDILRNNKVDREYEKQAKQAEQGETSNLSIASQVSAPYQIKGQGIRKQ